MDDDGVSYGVDHGQDEVSHFLLRMMGESRGGHVVVEECVDENGCFDVGSGCRGDGGAVALLPPLTSRPPGLWRLRIPADALDEVQGVVDVSVRRGALASQWLPRLYAQEFVVRQSNDASLIFKRNTRIEKKKRKKSEQINKTNIIRKHFSS